MTLSRRLRRLWLDVHLWIGVGLLGVIIPLGLSGSILVWHDALDRTLLAKRYAVSGPAGALPPQAYADAAQAAFGDAAQLIQIRLPYKAGDPVVAVGRIPGPPGPDGRPRSLNAWIDPPTGRVLDRAEVAKDFSMALHRLHGTLFIPSVGRKVVGWLGGALLVSCATGLWLWWPRHGALGQALHWRRGPSTLFNLHHLVGFWICLPLAVVSLTGVYIAFPQTSRALFGVPQPPAGPRGGPNRSAAPLAHPNLTLPDAVASAQAAAPGASLAVINLPTQGADPAWKIQLSRPGAGEPVTVAVNDTTGAAQAERASPSAAGGGPDPLSAWMRRVHDGADMGIVWQTLLVLAGLAPTLLCLTGLIMWLRRRARRRAIMRGATA
ncbi:PepSY domain-containing protein [Phenylobacterium sp. 20VBR1]|uniref:PepSY domain-containing protein n=1 Tax=Phenylobacterium glaciei TaxID=2803784 RepID=A0A941D5T6_9CAUL|nr:PepSY-associated TM helix domain-containing protein [Phenylobacterium glaciei]MBR7621476.1 PepSY domain-containing protein [Phenylobacterium glaciei]